MHSKQINMKAKTETILTISKYLALLGAVGYSILWGSQLLTLASSFVNPEWAKHTYQVDLNLFRIHDSNVGYYVMAMGLTIAVSVLKAIIWFIVFALLSKLRLQTPFSMGVQKKLEGIAYLLLAVWIVSSLFWKTFIYYLAKETGLLLPANNNGDEYLFVAAMIYVISQIFKRGIEIQEENQLTV